MLFSNRDKFSRPFEIFTLPIVSWNRNNLRPVHSGSPLKACCAMQTFYCIVPVGGEARAERKMLPVCAFNSPSCCRDAELFMVRE